MTSGFRRWFLIGTLALGVAQNASACAFHGYTPDPTLVDYLLSTEQVVIARPDQSDPGRYTSVEALLGPAPSEIPIAVAPATLAKLAARPSATVLLARDGAYGPWQELAVLDDTYRTLVDRVIERQSAWGLGNDAERLQMFADLVNDPNPDIRRLALQELDRAPYGALVSIRLPQVRGLREDLKTSEDGLTPIRVLLAGLSQDRSYSRFLSEELDTAVHNDVTYLGAYATALIELDGPTAVRSILDRHLSNGTLSLDTRTRLLQALAIQHKAAPPPTRRAITRGVTDLLRASPDLRETAASQFGFRLNWILTRNVSQAHNPDETTSVEGREPETQ